LTGGNGADVFTFANGDSTLSATTSDVITDFVAADDAIDLTTAGSGTNYVEAASAVATYADAASAAETALNGTVIYSFQFTATEGFLFVDTDGNGSANEVIRLTGVDDTGFSAADII